MQKTHGDYGLRLRDLSTHEERGDNAVQKVSRPMNTEITFKSPTQAEIDRHVARAHQLRSNALAAIFRAGLARLRALFGPKTQPTQASA